MTTLKFRVLGTTVTRAQPAVLSNVGLDSARDTLCSYQAKTDLTLKNKYKEREFVTCALMIAFGSSACCLACWS